MADCGNCREANADNQREHDCVFDRSRTVFRYQNRRNLSIATTLQGEYRSIFTRVKKCPQRRLVLVIDLAVGELLDGILDVTGPSVCVAPMPQPANMTIVAILPSSSLTQLATLKLVLYLTSECLLPTVL